MRFEFESKFSFRYWVLPFVIFEALDEVIEADGCDEFLNAHVVCDDSRKILIFGIDATLLSGRRFVIPVPPFHKSRRSISFQSVAVRTLSLFIPSSSPSTTAPLARTDPLTLG